MVRVPYDEVVPHDRRHCSGGGTYPWPHDNESMVAGRQLCRPCPYCFLLSLS